MSFRTYSVYSYTENGWRICNVDATRKIAPELSFMEASYCRSGAAALALEAWVRWYDANVPGEIVSTAWAWSRDNSVANSNHLSGTAVDINAPQYGYGDNRMHRLYPDRVTAIERGLAEFEGLIFWGSKWPGASKDEMHFQLNEGTANGDDASLWLEDFVSRRCPDGRLVGAIGSDTPEVTDVAFLRTADERVKLTADQLLNRWPQLGNRTFVDALADVFKKIEQG